MYIANVIFIEYIEQFVIIVLFGAIDGGARGSLEIYEHKNVHRHIFTFALVYAHSI